MSIYQDRQIPGELWLRDLKNNVDSASNVLSAIYLKYKNVNQDFYFYLNTNQIIRFDLFYDTIFIETPIGYIFEKYYIQDEAILPYNQINLFNSRKSTSVDYWFNESKNKVIYTELYLYRDPFKDPLAKYFEFILIVKSFDCNTGLIKTLLLDLIRVAYTSSTDIDNDTFTVEDPKITYNKDTKTYNISFIIRNTAKKLGLLSLNMLESDDPVIMDVNGFLPFIVQDTFNSGISSLKTLPFDISSYILTQMNEIIETELPESLLYDYI